MTENTFTIPAQTRTIFVKANLTNYKYKLNLPEFKVTQPLYVENLAIKRWVIEAIDCEGNLCHAPLLNVGHYGNICIGEGIFTKEEFVNALFCTYFNLDSTSSLGNYVKLPILSFNYHTNLRKIVDKFYKNWEKEGSINLVKMPKNDG
jgi:hypothetical protein